MGVFDKMVDTAAKKVLIDSVGDAVSRTAGVASKAAKDHKNASSTPISIKLPKSADDYAGRNFGDVEEELRAYGFVNIALLPKRDLLKGWLTKDGSVEEVSIAGKTSFKKGQRYLSDHRVVITYHTFRNAPLSPTMPPVYTPPVIQEDAKTQQKVPSDTVDQTSDFLQWVSEKPPKKQNEFRCKGCNGIMEIDFERGVLTCPYCGSTETITESDSVKIERIRGKVAAERLKHEKEEIERQEHKNAIDAFKSAKLSKILIVCAILTLMLTISNFRYRPFASVLMLASGAMLIFAWIVGAGFAKSIKQQTYIFFAIAGFALLIFAFSQG